MSNKSYFTVRRLVNDILSDLKNHPTYKDHLIEVCGVKRWDYN
jgi:hypothetical protein